MPPTSTKKSKYTEIHILFAEEIPGCTARFSQLINVMPLRPANPLEKCRVGKGRRDTDEHRQYMDCYYGGQGGWCTRVYLQHKPRNQLSPVVSIFPLLTTTRACTQRTHAASKPFRHVQLLTALHDPGKLLLDISPPLRLSNRIPTTTRLFIVTHLHFIHLI